MAKVNPSNEYETKSGIFPWDKFKSDIIFHWSQSISIIFVIGISQFYLKSE